jgi:hypothetical protein
MRAEACHGVSKQSYKQKGAIQALASLIPLLNFYTCPIV